MSKRLLHSQAGVTLIELIVAMIVISVALGGVLMVMNFTTSHSADPVLRHQAIAIAEAYMEEISLKEYFDPDDPLSPPNACPTSEGARDSFDNVCDYDNLPDTVVRDQTGAAIVALANYSVTVSVTNTTYGPSGDEVNGLRIVVTVTDPAGESLTLAGYRADY